ncbi:MAG: type I methionyl aminopeptidase [Candidatus Enteromonas sp.]|nr:type I methionyl aminopeptidase [Candidatus Enteromonas sp.]MDY6093974.1 type I methionyl aminopeptidase [Candidatus Enteromonas sp.]
MIIIKSPREIALMREAGRVVALVFEAVKDLCVPGVSTAQIDEAVERIIRENGAIPAEKGYYGYPASVCTSVNEVILHGIPSKSKILRDGDIISLDLVAKKAGYCADACRTYEVGICGERAKKMIAIARECFDNAVALVKPGVHLGDVSAMIEATAKKYGCSVPREYTGHGIGRDMHEDPYIPCYGVPGTGPILREGMTICIEPMIFEHHNSVRVLKDGWTVVAKDGGLTSHYENTIVVTGDGFEILTKL